MRSPIRPEGSEEVSEPLRLSLAVHGAGPDDAAAWLAGLDRAGFLVRPVAAADEAGLRAALRRPLDLVLVWDDEAGGRAPAALAAIRDGARAVPVVVVAHRGAGAAAVRYLDRGAYALLDPERPELLSRIATRLLADLHRETVTALTGRIAHDLNNLLAPIPLALQLLRDHGLPGSDTGHLGTIDVSVRGSMRAVRELSELVLARVGRPFRIRAKHLVALAAARLREALSGSRRVLSEYPPGLAPIRVDPRRLLEVLACLGRRALDAAEESEELLFRGGDVELAAGIAGGARGAATGVEIVVAAGRGAELATAAWAPSAGLGDLAEVREAVAAEGGTLEVVPAAGDAAVRAFRLLFPAADGGGTGASARPARAPERIAPPAEVRNERPAAPAGRAREAVEILVVEDEDDVREVTCAVLEARGYRVLAAADGAEGVALLADRQGRVALCLVDMGLPLMDGRSTVRALRRIDPAVKIVVSSGAGRGPASLEAGEDAGEAFLAKPYDAETLLRVIREVLATR